MYDEDAGPADAEASAEDARSEEEAGLDAQGGEAPPSSSRTVAFTGDARAVCEAMYRRRAAFVWRRLRRLHLPHQDAEDIHQEVFLIMYELIRRDGPPRNEEAMLSRIALHCVCNHRKVSGRRRIDPGVDASELPSVLAGTDAGAMEAAHKRIVERALTELKDEAAVLIRWIELGDVTFEEAAQILECSEPTLRSRHRRAMEAFGKVARRLLRFGWGGKR